MRVIIAPSLILLILKSLKAFTFNMIVIHTEGDIIFFYKIPA